MTSRRVTVAILILNLGLIGCKKSNPAGPANTANAIDGSWSGTLLQSNGANTFTYRMTLSHSGTQVTGTSHIEPVNQSQFFADFSVTGTISGSTFTFVETAITGQTLPPSGGIWCIKSGTLQLTATPRSLSGPWTASNCVNPGTIELH